MLIISITNRYVRVTNHMVAWNGRNDFAVFGIIGFDLFVCCVNDYEPVSKNSHPAATPISFHIGVSPRGYLFKHRQLFKASGCGITMCINNKWLVICQRIHGSLLTLHSHTNYVAVMDFPLFNRVPDPRALKVWQMSAFKSFHISRYSSNQHTS